MFSIVSLRKVFDSIAIRGVFVWSEYRIQESYEHNRLRSKFLCSAFASVLELLLSVIVPCLASFTVYSCFQSRAS